MPLEKMICGENYTTELLKDNVNGLIDGFKLGARSIGQFSPPSVSFSTSSTIANSIRQYPAITQSSPTPFEDSSFSYGGINGNSLSLGSSDSLNGELFTGASGSSTTGYWIPSISFDYTGNEVEIRLRANSSGDAKFMVEINGSPLFSNFQIKSVSSGSYYNLKLTFGDTSIKNITIKAHRLDFGGVNVQPFARAIKPYQPKRQKVVVLSNSICAGFALETFRWQCWPAIMGSMLNFDVYNISIGGTGFMQNQAPTYESRIADMQGINPDVIIFGDHYNDLGDDEAEVKQAMSSLTSSLKAQFPKAKLMMLGGWCVDENLSEKQISLDLYVRQLCSENNMTPLMYSNPQANWSSIVDWQSNTSYIQGEQVRYNGVVWGCVADHTSGESINTSGFTPSLIVNSDNNAVTLLSDVIHPTEDTCKSLASALSASLLF